MYKFYFLFLALFLYGLSAAAEVSMDNSASGKKGPQAAIKQTVESTVKGTVKRTVKYKVEHTVENTAENPVANTVETTAETTFETSKSRDSENSNSSKLSSSGTSIENSVSTESSVETSVETSAETEAAESGNSVLAGVSAGRKKWRFQGFATHLPELRGDQRTTTDILLRTEYNINKKHRIRLQQPLTKRYEKRDFEYEFAVADTTLAHFYRITPKPLGVSLQWRSDLRVPISSDSIRDNLVTRLTGSLIALRPFAGGKLLGIAVPFVRYHWWQFKSSVSGRRLPWYTLGLSSSLIYMITSKLSLTGSASYNFTGQINNPFDQDPRQLNNGTYRFDLDVTYQFTKNWSASVGYTQGANYIQDGRYEVNFFDSEVSRFYLGAAFLY